MPYDKQLVIAFIDGRKPKYNGIEVSDANGNVNAFLADEAVPQEEKDEFNRQDAERDNAIALHEKNKGFSELLIIEDYIPNSDEQGEKLYAALARVQALPENSRVYVVGHSDPDSRRMAGFDPLTMAGLLASHGRIARVKRINLVGCHVAGHAASAGEADLRVSSFASDFHTHLGRIYGVYTEVVGYTSFVTINPGGRKRVRFVDDPRVPRESKAPFSKARFYWTDEPEEERAQVRGFVYT